MSAQEAVKQKKGRFLEELLNAGNRDLQSAQLFTNTIRSASYLHLGHALAQPGSGRYVQGHVTQAKEKFDYEEKAAGILRGRRHHGARLQSTCGSCSVRHHQFRSRDRVLR